MPPDPNIPNNQEVDKALKEFEAEQAKALSAQTGIPVEAVPVTPPKHSVEGVSFDLPTYGAVKFYKDTETPKMVKRVMKWSGGAIKEERQAEWALLGFVVLAMIISIFLFFGGNLSLRINTSPTPPGPMRVRNFQSQ